MFWTPQARLIKIFQRQHASRLILQFVRVAAIDGNQPAVIKDLNFERIVRHKSVDEIFDLNIALVDIWRELDALDIGLLNWLQPNRLPDTGRACVENPLR